LDSAERRHERVVLLAADCTTYACTFVISNPISAVSVIHYKCAAPCEASQLQKDRFWAASLAFRNPIIIIIVVIIRLKQQEMYAHTTVTCGKSRRQSKSDNNGRRGVK